MDRYDYRFPFRIDAVSGQAARSGYAEHVDQMIRQVLLTSPGERADLPEFGCGIRQLLFAPHSSALDATTKLIVQQALNRWLAGQIEVKDVVVSPADDGDTAQLHVRIEYVLIETRSREQTEVLVF